MAPQTAAILDHDHVELTAPRSGEQCLTAGPVERAAADCSVSKAVLDQPTLHLIMLLCQRARWTAEPVEDSALLGAPARLAKRLLSLAALHGRETPGGTQLAISQEELAQFPSLSRQVVNQHLQPWRGKNWVSLGRGGVTIANERALRNLARGAWSDLRARPIGRAILPLRASVNCLTERLRAKGHHRSRLIFNAIQLGERHEQTL